MNHSQIRMVVLSRVSTHPIFIFHIVDLATTEVLIFWYLFLLLILLLLCADFCKASSVFKAVPFVRRLMFSTIFFIFILMIERVTFSSKKIYKMGSTHYSFSCIHRKWEFCILGRITCMLLLPSTFVVVVVVIVASW